MGGISMKKIICCFLTLLILFSLSVAAHAGSVTLTLTRTTLTNVNDAVGSWQHEGGKAYKGATQIGYYAAHRRVTTGGTTAQNTAMWTCEIFFTGTLPPENIVIQGSHYFSSGAFKGSVSAASYKYSWLRDVSNYVYGTAGATTTLYIVWNGAYTLTLP